MGSHLKEKIFRTRVEEHPLLPAIRDVCARMHALETQFAMESDGDLVEACIYEMEALRAQYRFLLKQAKAVGITGILPLREEVF